MSEKKKDLVAYSPKYEDDEYEYRHVILAKELAKRLPSPMRLLSETEWRSLGIIQSRGWEHYEVHTPEPHVLLFRRPLGTDPVTGVAPKKTVSSSLSASTSSVSCCSFSSTNSQPVINKENTINTNLYSTSMQICNNNNNNTVATKQTVKQ
eukprot:TRINITY_DN65_c0_g1_i4.p1 TRINITY_DN65_c0_g1~~TRINITY_DN65_c0_g1_i4.p1  ORF type:complete len:151 (-),score=39.69 TRINITY_DN65_c0_g1_i4:578-1030(-)